MNAVGVAQARRADLAVEQRVVHRVKHAIAHAAHHSKAGQHPVTGAERIAQCCHAQQAQSGKQNQPRKQRRQQQLAEMADHVGQPHQANHAGIAAQGRGLGGRLQGT